MCTSKYLPSHPIAFSVLNNKFDPPFPKIWVLNHVSQHQQLLIPLIFFSFVSLLSFLLSSFWCFLVDSCCCAKCEKCSPEVCSFWVTLAPQHGSFVEKDLLSMKYPSPNRSTARLLLPNYKTLNPQLLS